MFRPNRAERICQTVIDLIRIAYHLTIAVLGTGVLAVMIGVVVAGQPSWFETVVWFQTGIAVAITFLVVLIIIGICSSPLRWGLRIRRNP